MATAIRKRKREELNVPAKSIKKVAIQTEKENVREQTKPIPSENPTTRTALSSAANATDEHQPSDRVYIQVVTGSYERVLHGLCANIPRSALELDPDTDPDQVTYSDTFLFAAHTSSIRCLAISPPTDQQPSRRFLATGSSDERINVYSLSTAPPQADASHALPSLSTAPTIENRNNKSLGSLNHHDRAVTCLDFPIRTKLVSAAEDATISVSRTRDWTVLSSIKAPIPKPQGRPSGDTAAPGEVPAGVNGFAIHPSQRLMLSVGRGERCLRLWNMMTGKKAGVLNLDRDLLSQVGEGRHGAGEGRRVLWDGKGENYVVGFERGAAVFGIDSKPKAVIMPSPPTKLHQMRIITPESVGDLSILAVSTEDGRVLFYNIEDTITSDETDKLPTCVCIGQLGGRDVGVGGRVKDFEVLQPSSIGGKGSTSSLVITGSSDGAVRLWIVPNNQIRQSRTVGAEPDASSRTSQVGHLIGTLETGNRITCLGAFPLDGTPSDSTSDNVTLDIPEDKETSEEDEDSDEV